jgi:4-hydroxy-tetrahydrodipicolinate synthase
MKLSGVIVPAASPLDSTGRLDRPAFQRLVAFLLDSGANSVFANGSMGAFALLPDEVQYATVEAAVEFAGSRAPVLAGASESGTARVLEKIRVMAGMGVEAFVVLPPYYYLLNQRELLRFYLAVADASPRPVILYENPRLTKNTIAVETVADLAEHPNIAGIKVSNADVFYWQELLRAPVDRSRFSLISGAGKLTNIALRLGFDGITEGLHNIVPHLAVALFRAAQCGDHARAGELQQKINRCFGIFEVDGGWRGLEVAFQEMGIANRAAPAPYDLPVSQEARSRIVRILTEEDIPLPYAGAALAGAE